MALRLRRGTNTERQTATFSEGELIYVTDYVSAGVSPLWIGDGSTVGGNEVETGGIGGSGIIDGETYNISIVGNVIGGDSSIIVDSTTQVVTANLFVGSGAGLTDINLVDLDDVFAFGAQINDVLTYDGTGWIPSAPAAPFLEGIEYNINIQGDVIGLDSSILVNSATNDITGNDITGNDITGNIITANTKFVGDAIEYNSPFIFDPVTTGGFPTVSHRSTDGVSTLEFERISSIVVDPLNPQFLGQITFNISDPTPQNLLRGVIYSFEESLLIAAGVPGFSTTQYNNNQYLHLKDDSLCIGGLSPVEKLDVRGNGIFSGDVSAAAFKGSLMADDSTTIIDGISGNITAPGYIQFGSFSKPERDSLVASNGFVIYNTTSNRFQGFQNSAWINLDDGTADP
jgi:hypothetical protein